MVKLFLLPILALTLAICSAATIKESAPQDASPGRIHEWKTADGLSYQFVVPKSYDKEQGANLTFILHGSNLTRSWGFANHKVGEFRPDDIVVAPDGTTANGKGGFNFMGKDADIARFDTLQQELSDVFNITATFLYGHSQGSFFAFHYAGARPKNVQGVLGHASGVWTWSTLSSKSHHQAIVLMHGTQDRVVPLRSKCRRLQGLPQKRLPHSPSPQSRSMEPLASRTQRTHSSRLPTTFLDRRHDH